MYNACSILWVTTNRRTHIPAWWDEFRLRPFFTDLNIYKKKLLYITRCDDSYSIILLFFLLKHQVPALTVIECRTSMWSFPC